MRQQRIIGFGFGRDGRDEAARKRSADRLDGGCRNRRVPVVLVDDTGTEAHGMEIQVLGYGMMVVPGSRGALLIGAVGRVMGMVGRAMVRM
jgi:hypothetical protein